MSRVRMLFFLFLLSCGKKPPPVPSFYYWKTTYHTTPATQKTAAAIGAKKLYLRLCDIGIDARTGQLLPQDVLRITEPAPKDAEIVPVLFLELSALKKLKAEEAPALAPNIARFTQTFSNQQGWKVRELQLDCDWTAGTAAVYFALLRELKGTHFLQGKTLSVTLRLHQVKDVAKAGIPPADRCLLMVYNMGNFKTLRPESSIFDLPTAKAYLQNIGAYPLPLDVALPIFRWTLWYRNGQLLGILRGVDAEEISGLSFLQKTKETGIFLCTQNASLSGYSLQKGDLLKAESPQPEDVEALALFLSQKLREDASRTIVFYHLDDLNLRLYAAPQLQKILRAFQ